jgi:excinuclease ABC subunit C
MPTVFAGQRDLFDEPRQAGCLRHQFGFCSGPCAGFVTEWEYRRRVDTAAAFLEGRTIQPLDRVIAAMQEAAAEARFELAARWREKFEQLEWLLAATSRARAAVDLLTFVYRDPGVYGDDRAYLVVQGVVRATFPFPVTPIEQEAFRAVVAETAGTPLPPPGPLPLDAIDEILLLMSWFRAHPDALRRTTPLAEWVA